MPSSGPRFADWDAHEQEMAARFKLDAPVLSRIYWSGLIFLQSGVPARFVRKCPAKPAMVATFLLEQSALGASAQVVVAMLAAIEAIHQHHMLSNPCATAVVDAALDQIVKSRATALVGQRRKSGVGKVAAAGA